MTSFLQWLEEAHKQIMDSEGQALALLANDDASGYREKMREKAELLSTLYKRADPHLLTLPEDRRGPVARALRQFSASAATALDLGSVFYMSALLYRDDHRKGEPDNLQILIDSIRQTEQGGQS